MFMNCLQSPLRAMLRYVFFVFLLFFVSFNSVAQEVKSVELSVFLKKLEAKYKVVFSFDPELVKGRFIDDVESESLDGLLKKMEEAGDFTFERLDEKHILLLPKKIKLKSSLLRILDEEGLPLFAVLVKNNAGDYRCVSDENGMVLVDGEFDVTDSLSFLFVGSKSNKISIRDLSDGVALNVTLENEINYLQEVLIQGYLAPGINSLVHDHSLQIKQEDLAIIPGATSGDVLQSISILPGISSPNTKAGNLFLRGSTTDQTLVYFDNIPLYNKGHFFGTISPFNQQVVDEVKVYRSGAHPRIGGRVGGTIEIKTDSDIPDSTTTSIGMSMTNVTGYLNVPIVKNKLSFLISGRRSLPSTWQTPRQTSIFEFLNQDDAFATRVISEDFEGTSSSVYKFNDLNSKLIYKIDSTSRLNFSYLHTSSSRLQVSENESSGVLTETIISGANRGINAQWAKKWSRRFSSNSSLTYSKYTNKTMLSNSAMNSGGANRSDIFLPINREYILKVDNKLYDKRDLNYLDFGLQSDLLINNLEIDNYNPKRNIDIKNSIYQAGSVQSVYGSYNLRSVKNFSSNIGVRASYYDLTGQLYFEPRLFMDYQVCKSFAFKGSYNWSHQYVQQLIFFDFNDVKPENFNWGLANRNRPPVKSRQGMIGVLYHKKDWLVDVEAYEKEIGPIHASGGFVAQSQLLLLEGEAHMHGVDVLVRKKVGKVSVWTSYSLGEVNWEIDSLNAEPFPAYYDQRHKGAIGVLAKKGNWSLSGTFRYGSGMPVYDQLVFTPGSSSKDRYVDYIGRHPWHHQIDLSGAYTYVPSKKKWNAVISASIMNLYNKKTLLYEGDEQGVFYTVYTLGFSPDVQLIVSF